MRWWLTEGQRRAALFSLVAASKSLLRAALLDNVNGSLAAERVVDGSGSSVGNGGGKSKDGDDVGVHFEVSELVT